MAVYLASPAFLFAQELKPEAIYQRLLPSVLTLKVINGQGEKFTGSAFLALKPGIAVTAWHVVHDAQHVEAILANGTRVEVTGLVDKDEAHDIALIRVNLKEYPLVEVGWKPPSVGARMYVIGAPKGFGFSIADGLMSQVQSVDGFNQYQISCPLSTGNSGGPVVNERAQVIGVASWSRIDAQNVNFAVPIEHLKGLNPSREAVDWNSAKAPVGRQTELTAAKLSGPEDDLSALRSYLKAAAGRKITIIVRETEKDREFNFVVPE